MRPLTIVIHQGDLVVAHQPRRRSSNLHSSDAHSEPTSCSKVSSEDLGGHEWAYFMTCSRLASGVHRRRHVTYIHLYSALRAAHDGGSDSEYLIPGVLGYVQRGDLWAMSLGARLRKAVGSAE